jgi:hypothetical protein
MDVILQFVTLGSVIIGAAAIYIAVRNNSRQLGAQIFLAYSQRIHALRLSISDEAYGNRLVPDLDVELSVESRRVVYQTLQLIFEVHALKRYGYIDKHIWLVWEPDINRLLQSKSVGHEWPRLEQDFATHPRFVDWVKSKQMS